MYRLLYFPGSIIEVTTIIRGWSVNVISNGLLPCQSILFNWLPQIDKKQVIMVSFKFFIFCPFPPPLPSLERGPGSGVRLLHEKVFWSSEVRYSRRMTSGNSTHSSSLRRRRRKFPECLYNWVKMVNLHNKNIVVKDGLYHIWEYCFLSLRLCKKRHNQPLVR